MKKLLKYQLINGTIPPEIEDGGYFYNEPYIYGISVHLEESYTPEGMEWVSQSELEDMISNSNVLSEASHLDSDPIPYTPLTREIFESNHTPFHYRDVTPKDRITAIEDLIAELMEA
jgi:hypothetical protein